MKINPEKIITDQSLSFANNRIFLINGNEDTYIEKISATIVERLRGQGFEEVEKQNEIRNLPEDLLINEQSLFHNKKITIFNNIKNFDIEGVERLNLEDRAIIIIDKKIKNSSKLKNYFNLSKILVCVSCYDLSKEVKKKIADYFFSKNNIVLEKDCYWFFLDRSSDKYMLFENEIIKMISYDKKIISVKDLTLLLSVQSNENIDNLFFTILMRPNNIITESLRTINSSTDSYLLLQRAKLYLGFFLLSTNQLDASNNFPKYLFLVKDKYLNIFGKLSLQKKIFFITLVKRTEILLRKHNDMHLIVIQRFLLNLKKLLT